jgi:hypothetical protein
MTDSEQLMRTLSLGVAHLSDRTRALAEGAPRQTLTLAPVRETLELLMRTFLALEAEWDSEASPEAAPTGIPGNLSDTNSWLVDAAALYGQGVNKAG